MFCSMLKLISIKEERVTHLSNLYNSVEIIKKKLENNDHDKLFSKNIVLVNLFNFSASNREVHT